MTVAIAIDTQVIHHVDVDDVATGLLEVVMHSLSRCSHRLKEAVLIAAARPAGSAVARSVNVHLAASRRHADALVFQHTAEAAHGVTLEVGEVDHEVVVAQMASHNVVLQVAAIDNRQVHRVFFVHDVNRGDGIVSSLGNGLTVGCGGGAATTVGSVALHDIAADQLHKIFNEFGAQVVALCRLAGTDFHSHTLPVRWSDT